MQYKEIRKTYKEESSRNEDIFLIKDHLKRINKKLDEGNNRSLENHVALQSPNEIKCFVQVKELILKVFTLIDQDQKNEKIKLMQKQSLTFIENKISKLFVEKNELDAMLYLGLYQAILNCDSTGIIKFHDKLSNNTSKEEDFEFAEDNEENE